MTKRIHPREIEGLDTPGSAAVAGGAVAIEPTSTVTATDVQGAIEQLAAADRTALLTSSLNGEPVLVWDDNDNLVYAEGPTA